ncbi:MAG: hypothetical protein JO110_29410 [Acetobacteraceae bacterium]|nr:hypothetical protein [Acetobacteraceae bacterium]
MTVQTRLTRHGYSVGTRSEQSNATPAEIRRLLRGELEAARTRELAEETWRVPLLRNRPALVSEIRPEHGNQQSTAA